MVDFFFCRDDDLQPHVPLMIINLRYLMTIHNSVQSEFASKKIFVTISVRMY